MGRKNALFSCTACDEHRRTHRHKNRRLNRKDRGDEEKKAFVVLMCCWMCIDDMEIYEESHKK